MKHALTYSSSCLTAACFVSLGLAMSCGGKVVALTSGAGGGGGGATSTNDSVNVAVGSTAAGPADCATLLQNLETAIAKAQTCNPNDPHSECDGSVQIQDSCGCFVVA